MHHHFIDQYSELDSPLHRAKPELKIIFSLIFILAAVLAPVSAAPLIALYFGGLFLAVLLSRVPLWHHLKRILTLLPFTVLIALSALFAQNGWLIFLQVIIKSTLSILTLSLLFSTTPFPQFLSGLKRLRFPKIFIMLFSFMYRYVYILENELMRMQLAATARNFSGRPLYRARTLANMSGSLLLRAFERGERVYQAMAARGYQGL